jgi:uncharacterized membrane protein
LALSIFSIVWFGWPLLNSLFPNDLSSKMTPYRDRWALQILNHADRISDVGVARNLMASVSFFASTTVLLVGGLVGILGAADQIVPVLQKSTFFSHYELTSQSAFELKVATMLALFVHAFFKFGWSIRLHAYSTILIGATPTPELADTDEAQDLAKRIAQLSALASNHYASGVQSYYLSAALFAWFVHPIAMMAVLFVTAGVMVHREYFSRAAEIIR